MRQRGHLRAAAVGAALLCLAARAAAAAPDPQPPDLRLPVTAAPAGYAAELTIDPGRDSFHGAVDIDVNLRQPSRLLWLNATELAVERASAVAAGETVGVHAVPGGEEFVGLAFDREVAPGALKLHVEYTGRIAETSTQGVFRQKDGGDWYVYTQFESTDARRAFPCFDEPSYKVPFQLTLRIPKGTSALSNTPVESDEVAADGGRLVRFERTEPLPTYLVAFGVGPFEYVDAGRAGTNKTPIRIVTPRGKASRARYARETTGQLLEKLEAYFGMPFPYAKLDQLAIPQTVSFGAMENAGLITWSESILLAEPAQETILFRQLQASINAHELAHQWFGDLVTLAWWDDVWLNESFATWMADRTMIAWKPEWGGEVDRAVATSNVMYQDTLVSARKIRQEILTQDDIDDAFDGITYQKGAAVLTMFEAWVGAEKFRAGVRRYLEAHRWGNATVRDFLQALEAASRPGVAAAFSTFLDQAGVPLVEVSLECGEGGARIALSQKRLLPIGSKGSSAEVWRIPVCVRDGAATDPERACEVLAQPTGTMPAPVSASAPPPGCPAWVLANDNAVGYYRSLYRGDLLDRLLAVADRELTLPERVGLLRDVNALSETGALPMGVALALVPRFSGESARPVVEATLRIAADVSKHLVPAELRPDYARFLSRSFGERAKALGFAPRPGEDDDARILRVALVPFVADKGDEPRLQEEARRLAVRWLDDRSALDPDLVSPVLGVAARHGDEELFDRFVRAARTASVRRDRIRLYNALGLFPEPALVERALPLFLSSETDARESDAILFAASGEPGSRQLVWDFVRAHYDEIVARLPREETSVMPLLAGDFCDAEHRREIAEFFRDRIEKLPGGPRRLAQTLETIDLCIASRAVQEPSVREFLKGSASNPGVISK
jgi:alanyl aminopeptidase